MKKFAATLTMLCLLCAGVGAQESPKFEVPLPTTAQVLKMRYPGLVEWASKHPSNELQLDELASWYNQKRSQANQALVAGKPTLREAIAALRAWDADYYWALYLYNGGGTLYTHCGARSVATIADLEADAAAQWSDQPKTRVSLQAPTFLEFHPLKAEVIIDKTAYSKAGAKEGVSLRKAKLAIEKLPPGARNLLSKYVVDLAKTHWGEDQ